LHLAVRRLAIALLLLAGVSPARAAAPAPSAFALETTRCWALANEKPSEAMRLADALVAAAEAGRPPPGTPAEMADRRLCRGNAHELAGDLATAGPVYEAGVAEGARLGDREVLATALVLRGDLAYYRGDFTKALSDLNRAHQLYRALGNRARAFSVLNEIANVYADDRVGAYDRAIEYYTQIAAGHRATGNVQGLAVSHFNLGSTYERKGDLHRALDEYRQGAELDRRRGDLDEVAFDERAVASTLVKLGRPREAIGRLDASIARFRATGNDEMVAFSRLTRGIARHALGDLAGALSDLDAAAAHFAADDNDRFLVRVEQERAGVLAARGDFAAAFAARTRQLELESKLAEVSRDESTSRLRVQFETAQKERENRALARENALRGSALRDAERIRDLQRAVLLLAAVLLVLLVALAVRQLRRARRLQALAMTDELTRLPNRRSILAHAEQHLQRARRSGEPLAVLVLDVDHFKRINDGHGHDVGDRVLQRVAHAARGALRPGDLVGRIGGEEFLALLPATTVAAAGEIAERLRAAVERLDVSDLAPSLAVAVSVGVAGRGRGRNEPNLPAFVQRADEALYRAKASGRNRVEVAGDEDGAGYTPSSQPAMPPLSKASANSGSRP
jgi:diguanylate cyclase (GGDEF)-like protein